MTTPLALTTDQGPDGAPVLRAVGEIDMSNAQAFAAALADAARGPRPLVVDLTAVEYLDSAALTALFAHAGHIAIRAAAVLEPVITLSGLSEVAAVTVPDGGDRSGAADGAAPVGAPEEDPAQAPAAPE